MTQRGAVIALTLVAAFLFHDSWMAHAGHVVYPDPAASMDQGMHDARIAHQLATMALVSPDAIITPELPIPSHETCPPIRIAALHPALEIALVSAVHAILALPITSTEPDKSAPHAVTPPAPPPDVRRALLQVFLI